MIALIGTAFLLMGAVNMAWFLLWFLLAWSSTLGAKVSKKVGTDNENTDSNIQLGEAFKREALQKFAISTGLLIVGSVLTHIGS
ncbi:MAG: hypothetical protein ACFB14_17220 [Leptolyngbyaceae cyanobacterium]